MTALSVANAYTAANNPFEPRAANKGPLTLFNMISKEATAVTDKLVVAGCLLEAAPANYDLVLTDVDSPQLTTAAYDAVKDKATPSPDKEASKHAIGYHLLDMKDCPQLLMLILYLDNVRYAAEAGVALGTTGDTYIGRMFGCPLKSDKLKACKLDGTDLDRVKAFLHAVFSDATATTTRGLEDAQINLHLAADPSAAPGLSAWDLVNFLVRSDIFRFGAAATFGQVFKLQSLGTVGPHDYVLGMDDGELATFKAGYEQKMKVMKKGTSSSSLNVTVSQEKSFAELAALMCIVEGTCMWNLPYSYLAAYHPFLYYNYYYPSVLAYGGADKTRGGSIVVSVDYFPAYYSVCDPCIRCCCLCAPRCDSSCFSYLYTAPSVILLGGKSPAQINQALSIAQGPSISPASILSLFSGGGKRRRRRGAKKSSRRRRSKVKAMAGGGKRRRSRRKSRSRKSRRSRRRSRR